MTTEEKFKQILVNNGMFDFQAEQVMFEFKQELAKADDYKVTWSRPANEYPDAFYSIHKSTLYQCAVRWIDANIPFAWYRAVFLI